MAAAHSTVDIKFCLHGPKHRPLPGYVQAEKDEAQMQLKIPSLAQNLDRDDNTYSFSRVDNPKKDPFRSSWILLLFKILWRENVRQ